MANLSLKHIYKVYPNGTKAVNDFNMDIKDKEFIVFVGPSGCGKSTTLRMIAGLEKITHGELTIGDEVVNSLEPKDRDIAMVFQNYALYPHMTIFENIAFGLRTRKVPKEIIDKKVKEVASILGITDYLYKKPKEMSGGQRQRVALGRAIVREPKVMLLDEPLSNLDAKLRTQMRSEIVKLHKKLNTTFIYVTHDQVEAMTMGTRIVVMKDGFVKQIDTPKNLYKYPENKFVASFIGSPQMNFFRVNLVKEEEKVKITFLDINKSIYIPFEKLIKIDPTYLNGEKEVYLGIRSENIKLHKSDSSLKIKVSHNEELGNETIIYGDINLDNDNIIESETKIIVKVNGFKEFEPQSIVDVSFDLDEIHLFDKVTEEAILKRVPSNNFVSVTLKNDTLELFGKEFKLPKSFKVEEGKYDALIPLNAICLKSGEDAKIVNREEVNKGVLCRLDLKGHALFTLLKEDKAHSTVGLDLDFAKITLLKDGETVVSPLKTTNEFEGKFIVKREKDSIFKTHNEYFVSFLNREFKSSENVTKKMCRSYENRRDFNEDFIFKLDATSPHLLENGIEVTVNKIIDYRLNKYAIITLDDKELIVDVTSLEVENKINIAFDIDKLRVIEKNRDITII